MIDIIKEIIKNHQKIFSFFLHLWFLCLCIIECVERLRNCDDIDKSKQFTKKSQCRVVQLVKTTVSKTVFPLKELMWVRIPPRQPADLQGRILNWRPISNPLLGCVLIVDFSNIPNIDDSNFKMYNFDSIDVD